jgi:LmbE family N-acetylglucosaminyl deacetylase
MQTHDNNPVPARPERLLGIWAHPDDEAYLSAGLMADVVARGGHVTVVVMTDGEQGFAADDPRTLDERSRLRRTEMHEAMAVIGVDDVRFLSVPDGFVARVDTDLLVTALIEVMAEVRPDLTITFGPDGITGHDDHIAAGHAATAAWMDHGGGGLLYGIHAAGFLDEWRVVHDGLGIWMNGEPEGCAAAELELVVDLDGEALVRKRAVLACHGSQTAGLAAVMGERQYRSWIAREFFRRPRAIELSASVVARSLGIRWETLAGRERAMAR